MVQKRAIFLYAASAATIHLGKDGQSLAIWFETVQGPVHVKMPLESAGELADQIAFALDKHPPKTTRQ